VIPALRLAAVILMFPGIPILSGIGQAQAGDPPPACRHLPTATLTGTIRPLGVVQIEPAASPRYYFRLELGTPWCAAPSIDFSLSRPAACLDGDVAAVTGELWPPSPPFDIPLFEARPPVVCTRAP